MTGALSVFRREFAGYFATPLAYIFIIVFLFVAGIFTFYVGSFFPRGQADLTPFFTYLPWLFLFLLPAIGMRLWAEERRAGTIELLLTLPISVGGAVVGKFLAAWAFSIVALALTFPLWITVAKLGQPDNGVIFASYIGAALMAGGYLAIAGCLSAVTRNQVIAFVVGVVICFLFTVAGSPLVLNFFTGWASPTLLSIVAATSIITHFNAITLGVIDLRDVIYFVSLIAAWLAATVIVVDLKKAD